MKKLATNNEADIAGGAAMMGIVVATLIAIVVGVMIWYKLSASVFASAGIPARLTTSTTASNVSRATQLAVWNSTNATANTIWTLFPIVCIVLIAGVVLAIVMGFGRQ